MNIQILIPSRMESTRLPGKPLADICGKAMICHVVDRAREAGVGEVTVAAGSQEIVDAVEAYGAKAILTSSDLPSGSDRIWSATQKLIKEGGKKPDLIINVQGDEPLLPPELIQKAVKAFELDWPDVVTFAHPIDQAHEKDDPGMVKVVTDKKGEALYFSRSPIPYGADVMKRHIGFYAYRYSALEKFVSTSPSALETQEKLEQLRGLEIGLRYYVEMTNKEPVGVDTPRDLEHVRAVISGALK